VALGEGELSFVKTQREAFGHHKEKGLED